MDKEKTKVVFRVWTDAVGGVIALFPQIPADNQGWLCSSYMHVGQHGAANVDLVVLRTRRATPSEYKDLAKELRSLGYNLDVKLVCTAKDRQMRSIKLKG